MNVSFSVSKRGVYDEVAKTTSYIGAKQMQAGTDIVAYERIFTTDEDRNMLERFWLEACTSATDQLKPFVLLISSQPVTGIVNLDSDYSVTLALSSRYDLRLSESVQASLFSFFVNYITAKWLKYTNKDEVEAYGNEAIAMMDDIKRKVYYKKAPVKGTGGGGSGDEDDGGFYYH